MSLQSRRPSSLFGRNTRTRVSDDHLKAERELWGISAQILAGYGDRAADFVYRLTQHTVHDEEERLRWRSIIDKLAALSGPRGTLH